MITFGGDLFDPLPRAQARVIAERHGQTDQRGAQHVEGLASDRNDDETCQRNRAGRHGDRNGGSFECPQHALAPACVGKMLYPPRAELRAAKEDRSQATRQDDGPQDRNEARILLGWARGGGEDESQRREQQRQRDRGDASARCSSPTTCDVERKRFRSRQSPLLRLQERRPCRSGRR